MTNFRAGEAFANSFMRGFGIVDEAMARRRQEQRIKDEIEARKQEREFNRTMRAQENARAAARAEREKTDYLDRRARQALLDESNATIAEVGFDNLTDEQIARYATVNPRIQAEIDKDAAMAERIANVRAAQGIYQAQTPSDEGGLSAGVAGVAGVSAPEAAADEAAATAQNLFAPALGLQEATIGELRQGSPGTVDSAPDAGRVSSPSPFGGPLGLPSKREARSFEQTTVQLPADRYYSQEELDSIQDPAEKKAALESNDAVIAEAQAAARSPRSNQLTPAAQFQEGAEAIAGPVRQQIEAYVAEYEAFVNSPRDSKFFALAAENPTAASQQYFQTRNTVKSVNPELARQVDQQMVPVLNRYSAQLAEQAAAAPAGSPEQRRYMQSLNNVQHSRMQIAESQPLAARIAGIRGGLKLGDTTRIGDVQAVFEDPLRPRYPTGTRPSTQVRGAATIAGRVNSATKRLSDRQIEALLTLSDEGYIDGPTAQTVMMTGQWPPGKDPNTITKITETNGYAIAWPESGNPYIVPSLSHRVTNPEEFVAKEKSGSDQPDRTFNMDKLDTIVQGAKIQNPAMTPEYEAALRSFMLDFAPKLRQSHYLDSEENLLLLGKMYMQSQVLAHQSQDDGMWLTGWFGAKDRTPEELFFNPAMREEYARNFESRPVNIPERLLQQPLDATAIRSELKTSGILAGTYTDEQIDQMTEIQLNYLANLLWQDPAEFGKE